MARRAQPNISPSGPLEGVSRTDRGTDLMGTASGDLHPGILASRTTAVRSTGVENSPVKPVVMASGSRRSLLPD